MLEALWHFAVDDALRQAFDNRGLAHARLADQHRIVLGAAGQDLNGAANLVIATDHRVELALLGARGQINGVFFQGLPLILGILIRDLLAAAHGLDALLDQGPAGAGLAQQRAQFALVLQRRQHEQLGADVAVLALLGEFVAEIEQTRQGVGNLHIAAGALDARQTVERFAKLGAQQIDVDIGLGEQGPHRAAVLIEQCCQHMHRLDELVIAAHRQALSVAQSQLKLAGQFVHTHACVPRKNVISLVNRGGFTEFKTACHGSHPKPATEQGVHGHAR